MDENNNKRPRPRRSIGDVTPKEAQQKPVQPQQQKPVQPQQQKPAQPAQQKPVQPQQQKPAQPQQQRPAQPQQQRPAQPVQQKPVQPPQAKSESAQSPKRNIAPNKPYPNKQSSYADFAEDENEKTRLTAAQPKVRLKTPVRQKNYIKDEGGTAASGAFKAIIYMTVVLLVSILLAISAISVGNDVFAFVKSDRAVEIVVPENATVADITKLLGDAGVIKYPAMFRIYASLHLDVTEDKDGNSIFIPGTYTVSPMKNYMQLLDGFQKQYTRDVVWVTIPEGSTVDDIITILTVDNGISTREDFVRAINEYDYELDFIDGLTADNGRYYRLEGYLFPDTYQFYTDSNAETVIYRMLVNFRDKLAYIGADNCKERLDELGMTLDEVVTLASIIEKEVQYAVDYDSVASVFYNRLNDTANFPRLDSDATSAYAVQMATGKRPESIGATEVNFESPYNTRVSNGLPPGAISNSGYEALYCAFYPAKTNYYYFVADSSGYNLYARTYAGHQENIASVQE